MGYYVNLVHCDVYVPVDRLDEGYRLAYRAMTGDDGAPPPGTLRLLLEELGFGVDESSDGLEIVEYDGKSYDEDAVLRALAPLVPAGARIGWHGSDDEQWQWVFDGTSMRTEDARTVWPSDATRSDVAHVMRRAMSDLSEERWAAGWLVDLAHVLWDREPTVPGLIHLAVTFDVWPTGPGEDEWLRLPEWRVRHGEWHAARKEKLAALREAEEKRAL